MLVSKPLRLGLALGTAAAVCLTMTAAASAAAASQRVPHIGAFAGTASQWNAAYTTIGPLQVNKEFYSTTKLLPASFSGSTCAHLAHNPVCIVTFKTPTNLDSFVKSIPAHRNLVIMVYYQEPELTKDALSPGAFKTKFDKLSGEIRQDAKDKHLTNVRVAMDSATYQYAAPGSGNSRGYSCAYIPLPKYVDYYLADVYQPTLIGLQNDAEFHRWNHCTAGKGKPQGIAEYGLGVCVPKPGTFTEQDRANTLAADAGYLAKAFPKLLMWEYWWSTISGSKGACDKWQFPLTTKGGAESPTLKNWKKIVAGTLAS